MNKNTIESIASNNKMSGLIDIYTNIVKVITGTEIIEKDANKYRFTCDTADGEIYVGTPLTIYNFFEHFINVDIAIEDNFDGLFLTEFGSNMLEIKSYIFTEIIEDMLINNYLSVKEFNYICANKKIEIYE